MSPLRYALSSVRAESIELGEPSPPITGRAKTAARDGETSVVAGFEQDLHSTDLDSLCSLKLLGRQHTERVPHQHVRAITSRSIILVVFHAEAFMEHVERHDGQIRLSLAATGREPDQIDNLPIWRNCHPDAIKRNKKERDLKGPPCTEPSLSFPLCKSRKLTCMVHAGRRVSRPQSIGGGATLKLLGRDLLQQHREVGKPEGVANPPFSRSRRIPASSRARHDEQASRCRIATGLNTGSNLSLTSSRLLWIQSATWTQVCRATAILVHLRCQAERRGHAWRAAAGSRRVNHIGVMLGSCTAAGYRQTGIRVMVRLGRPASCSSHDYSHVADSR